MKTWRHLAEDTLAASKLFGHKYDGGNPPFIPEGTVWTRQIIERENPVLVALQGIGYALLAIYDKLDEFSGQKGDDA